MKIKFLLTGVLFFLSSFSYCQEDVILKAAKKELNRSFSELKNAEKAPLYFLQYEIWQDKNYWVSANLGALVSEGENEQNTATADIRIGSRELDNTHEIKGKESRNWESNSKEIETELLTKGDENAIRAKLWNLTDAAYKDALNKYMKVEANKQVTAGEEDKSGDFSQEKTTDVYYSKAEDIKIDKDEMRKKIKELSLIFKKYDFILNSWTSFSLESQNRYIVNSDGAEIVAGNNYMSISYGLTARTTDGMDLSRNKQYHFDKVSDIPSFEKIAADMENSVKELKALIGSPSQEPYTGPAILENQAAAVFWHEIFGHRIEGHRQKSESEGQTFAKKIGEKIMPDFLNIYDDPNIRYFKGKFLRGYYSYDDEAVRAQKASLVEKGVLKGFLMQRVPLEKFPKSNGHGRRSEGNMTVARQGNLIAESSNKVPYEKLREMLLDEVKKQGKPYGIIIKDIAGGFTITQRFLPQSYTILIKYAVRVYPDGRLDEPIRGLNMIGTPLQTFGRILAAADDDDIFNGTCGAESGWVPVSAVSPSLLFSEIETEKLQKSNEMPPILKNPIFEK
ncbi:MAG: TldD/PmbA family protein [Elusimicrobia bacterium]|nr:TldD/PmbA family protein [Elusimicrobiota bacterium]